MENQQSNSGRSSGFTFLRAPSHFLFSKTRKQWLMAQRVITTTRCRRSQKKAYSSGTARDSHPFPFSHVSIHANGRGHLRDRVSPAKVIMKKNKAKGFDGFLAIGVTTQVKVMRSCHKLLWPLLKQKPKKPLALDAKCLWRDI